MSRILRFLPHQYLAWQSYVTACRRQDQATADKIVPPGSTDWVEGPFLVQSDVVPELDVQQQTGFAYLDPLQHSTRMRRPIAFGHQLVAVSQAAVGYLSSLYASHAVKVIRAGALHRVIHPTPAVGKK